MKLQLRSGVVIEVRPVTRKGGAAGLTSPATGSRVFATLEDLIAAALPATSPYSFDAELKACLDSQVVNF